MKRILSFLTAMLIFTASVIGATYYVSTSGSDIANGTSRATAWKTLNKVNSSVFVAGDNILFQRGGTWEGTLNVTYSGNSTNRITYGAYGTGSTPKIYCSTAITGWVLHSGNIYKKTSWSTDINQLFFNGVRLQAARTPNNGQYYYINTVNSTTSFTSASLNGAINYAGAKCFMRNDLYVANTINVNSSSGTTINLASAPFGGLTANTEGFILIGKLEFLDTAGEWYYDAASQTIYAWFPNNVNPSTGEVRGSTINNGIAASGKNYFTIKNITVLHPKFRGISLSSCDNAIIDGVTVSYPNEKGIYAISGCDYNNIKNSTVNYANHIGIEIFGTNNTIEDNNVTSTALFVNLGLTGLGSWYMGSGIYVEGNDNLIRYNKVINTGYNGIHIEYRNTVEYNYIKNCNLTKDDGGGIYTSSTNSYPNARSVGTIIRYNIIDGSYGTRNGFTTYPYPFGEGIYLDQWSGGITVNNNIVTNCSSNATYSHYGYNHTITNNLYFRNKIALFVKYDARGVNINNNVVYGFSRDLNNVQSEQMIWCYSNTQFPTVNNNKYINHYKSTDIFMKESTKYNFANWKTASGQDSGSTVDNTALSVGYSERLIYNNTKSAKTYGFYGATNVKNEATGLTITTLTLQPFTGVVLTGQNLSNIK